MRDQKEQPSYYANIPAVVRYDNELSANEKLLYGEISALSNKEGYCWSENRYFADLYNVHKNTVSGWVSSLEKRGHIRVKLIYANNSKQVKQRRLYLASAPIQDKSYSPHNKKLNSPIHEKTEEELSTTRTNTTSTNTTSAELTDRFEKLWKLYPRKKGRKDALRHYKGYVKEGITDEEIAEGIKSYIKEIEANKTEDRYIKHGSAWFYQKGWTDEYETNRSNNNDYSYSITDAFDEAFE